MEFTIKEAIKEKEDLIKNSRGARSFAPFVKKAKEQIEQWKKTGTYPEFISEKKTREKEEKQRIKDLKEQRIRDIDKTTADEVGARVSKAAKKYKPKPKPEKVKAKKDKKITKQATEVDEKYANDPIVKERQRLAKAGYSQKQISRILEATKRHARNEKKLMKIAEKKKQDFLDAAKRFGGKASIRQGRPRAAVRDIKARDVDKERSARIDSKKKQAKKPNIETLPKGTLSKESFLINIEPPKLISKKKGGKVQYRSIGGKVSGNDVIKMIYD
jgi:hypothetical protein